MDLILGFLTGGWGWVVTLAKRILPKLTLRNILIFLGICLLIFAQWKFYDWAHERGEDKQAKADAKQISALTEQRDDLQTQYDAYRGAFKTWVYRSEVARLTLAKENAAIVAGIETRLKAQEAQSAELRERLKHEITNRIPAAVDYDLPRGFVRLWHDSFEGETGTASAGQAGLAYGIGDDAQRASGLKLSGFAAIGIDNNQECVARGQVIREWQGWYYKHKDLFERVQQQAADAVPHMPLNGGDHPPSSDSKLSL